MQKINNFSGQAIAIRGNDIDTDRIIPARFMKCVTFDGLGQYAFNDERLDGMGQRKGHPFDDQRWQGHPILVVNANFGCGSSREHAPQALKDYGIGSIIGESFAEIFAGNCSSLGIPAVSLSLVALEELQTLIEEKPETQLRIDLESKMVLCGEKSWELNMPEAYRQALLAGTWDSTALLAASMKEIEAVATHLPYIQA